MSTAEAVLARYRPGESIAGHLKIEALLGEGGAGAVYRVRDQRTGGRFALKQLRAPEGENRSLLTSQFAHEYHALSQLAHPRIIEVYDYGVDRGCPYYTMELLDGQDLRDRGKLPFREASAILRDVASSLAIVHSRGLVHRDVSARNVRCTSDGRAKLIDFGAMVPSGSSQRAVGTPPFVAPEVLQMQAIDARADLYGLGALAYFLLTGRNAYPAQTFHQLREAWRRPPRKPSDLAADVPQSLSDLVMALLQLDRDHRPRSAAEVMERLSGIAGLPIQELPQVGRAYLVTPSLVDRAALLRDIRQTLLGTMRARRGGALLIEGAPGVGRSRFLDACVLDAKLMGATVLRSAPRDALQGDYGAIRSLLSQLFEVYPELCAQTAAPRAALLAHVLPGVMRNVAPAVAPERRHVQAALRDFFLAITRTKHVVIAIDDLAGLDEPSIALLGALAHGAQRRRLSLLLTALSGEDAAEGLGVLREMAERVALLPLDAEQTEALLRSLFGDSPHVATLAARLHVLSGGNPRELMSLADHLVTRGLARYEAGSWTLPLELSNEDLPQSDRAAAELRIAQLGPAAHELGELLSLADVRALSLAQLGALGEHDDFGNVFGALHELLRAGILVAETDRYRLSANDVLAPLAETMTAQRARALHARLARVLPDDRRSGARLMHLLKGGREQDAIDRLLAGEPDELYPGRLHALECAAEAAATLQLPLRTQLELHYRIARLSALTSRPDLFDRYGWPLIERFKRDSSLLDYAELGPGLDEDERLASALRNAQQRYDACSPSERGFSPDESMVRLVALCASCNSIATQALDLPLLERLPSLAPFAKTARSIRLLQRGNELAISAQAGRFEQCLGWSLEMLSELEDPEGMNPTTVRTMRLTFMCWVSLAYAADARAECEQWLTQLDTQPGYRGNAWRFRMVYQLALGNLESAAQYERRAELLDLQDAGGLVNSVVTVHPELLLHATADNLTGVKRAAERIARVARVYPRWSARLAIAQALYKRLQGDLEGALLTLEPALLETAPARHLDWSLARFTELRLLVDLGRAQDAVARGVPYIDDAIRLDVTGASGLKGIVAEALAALSRVPEAERLAEECIAEHLAAHVGGTRLGLAYEMRARVAIAATDLAAFELCAERCADLFLAGRSPHLRARYDALLRAAADAGLAVANAPPVPDEAAPPIDDDARTVYSRMLTCISPAERAERALQLLLEATGARTGYFFGLRAGKIALLFSPEAAPAAALTTMLEDCLERELGALGTKVPEGPGLAPQPIAAPLTRYIDELGRTFEPLVLAGHYNGEAVIAGVAALHYAASERPAPRRSMLDAVIAALISEDVVDPITCVA